MGLGLWKAWKMLFESHLPAFSSVCFADTEIFMRFVRKEQDQVAEVFMEPQSHITLNEIRMLSCSIPSLYPLYVTLLGKNFRRKMHSINILAHIRRGRTTIHGVKVLGIPILVISDQYSCSFHEWMIFIR